MAFKDKKKRKNATRGPHPKEVQQGFANFNGGAFREWVHKPTEQQK